jgi:hypothetical protein
MVASESSYFSTLELLCARGGALLPLPASAAGPPGARDAFALAYCGAVLAKARSDVIGLRAGVERAQARLSEYSNALAGGALPPDM